VVSYLDRAIVVKAAQYIPVNTAGRITAGGQTQTNSVFLRNWNFCCATGIFEFSL
jgi:hypothetical protein